MNWKKNLNPLSRGIVRTSDKMKGSTNSTGIDAVGDFCDVYLTEDKTVNVGANWTNSAIYTLRNSRGSSISFLSGYLFTINKAGTYLAIICNRHDSSNFGGSGINVSTGIFAEATTSLSNTPVVNFLTFYASAGTTVSIQQYGDQGTLVSYSSLNHCSIQRIA